MRYLADPPATEEIVAVMRSAGDRAHGRICEALALAEADMDRRRGSPLVRRDKGGRRRLAAGGDEFSRRPPSHLP
jgi:hypothetical protein